MDKLIIICAIFILVGCSDSVPVISRDGYYREVLYRTKNVYTVDSNIDENSSIEISFFSPVEGQLVELNITSSKLYSFVSTLVNSDNSFKKNAKSSNIHLGQLKVQINGVDATACLIDECNSTNCIGQSSPISQLIGDFSTKIFINLAKMSFSSNPSCSSLSINTNAMNVVKISENAPGSLGNKKGAHISAQVLVYNKTYRPQDIFNTFNQ